MNEYNVKFPLLKNPRQKEKNYKLRRQNSFNRKIQTIRIFRPDKKYLKNKYVLCGTESVKQKMVASIKTEVFVNRAFSFINFVDASSYEPSCTD